MGQKTFKIIVAPKTFSASLRRLLDTHIIALENRTVWFNVTSDDVGQLGVRGNKTFQD